MALKLQSHPLQTLPGLKPEQLAQLQQVGLNTTNELIEVARSPAQLQAVATRMKLPLRYLQKWAALANLSQLPSVGCQYCGLLLHAGVASVPQLATQAPGQLHTRIRKLHTLALRRADLCPTPDQIVQWVREAKLAQN